MISRSRGASQVEIHAEGDRAGMRIDESVVDPARQRISEAEDFRIPVRVAGERVKVLDIDINARASRRSDSLGKYLWKRVPDHDVLDARVIPALQPAIRHGV